MKPDDISHHMEGLAARIVVLESKLGDPELVRRQSQYKEINTEYQKLKRLFSAHAQWLSALKAASDAREMAEMESDEELKALALAELSDAELALPSLESKLRLLLLPPDLDEGKDIIVEIRPGAGGEEASLFAAELHRAYCKFAEAQGWRTELLDMSQTSVGGVKEVVFSLAGEQVYAIMRYESGVHRVQRVPITESGGRTHTSTITVAILAEAEEIDVDVKADDLRYDYFRSSGPGGQNVNRTDSAVRVTHIPTGLSVASQQEKSQHRNKATALRILRARLLEITRREEAAKAAETKRGQIGTGDRSERIRTYNFPQNRVTDHRYGISVFDLPGLMEGNFGALFDGIVAADFDLRLASLRK